MRARITFLLAVMAAACAPDQHPPPTPLSSLRRHYEAFSDRALQARVERVRPYVEQVLDHRLADPIRIEILSTAEWTERQIREICGDMPLGEERRQAELRVRLYSSPPLANVDASGRIQVLPDNFLLYDASIRGRIVDVVLAHELVHVHQWQRFGPPADIEGRVAQLARSAAIEGHAEHVSRQVATRLDLLTAFEAVHPAPNEVTGPLATRDRRHLAHDRFLYREGERFFSAVVSRLGYDAACDRVFSRPPRTLRSVSRPDEYLAGKDATMPNDEGIDRVLRYFQLDDADVRPLHSPALALHLADAGEAEARRAIRDVRSSFAAAVQPRLGPLHGETLLLRVTDAGESAKMFLETLARSWRARGRRTEADLRDGSAEVTSLQGAVHLRRTDRGWAQTPRDIEAYAFRTGPYVVELVSTSRLDDRAALRRIARRIRALLGAESEPWQARFRHRDPSLDDPDADVRARAVMLSAGRGDAPRKLIDDEDVEVRLAVVRAADRTLLADALRHRDAAVRACAAARVDDASALLPCLEDPAPTVRAAALRRLARISPPPKETWERLASDAHATVRLAALETLAESGSKSRDVFVARLADPSELVRGAAWDALLPSDAEDSQVLRGLRDPSPHVRSQVLRAMGGGLRGPEVEAERRRLLAELLRSDDPIAIVSVTSFWLDEGMLEALAPLYLEALDDPNARFVALPALERSGVDSPELRSAVIRVLPDPQARGMALELLSNLGASELAPVYRLLLRDWDPMIKATAALALRAVGEDMPDLVAVLRDALRDGTQPYKAATALGELGAEAKAAIPDLRAATRAMGALTRMEAVESLVKIAPPDDATLTAIIERIGDPEESVRGTACEALGDLARKAREQGRLARLVARAAAARPLLVRAVSESTGHFYQVDVVAAALVLWPEDPELCAQVAEHLVSDDFLVRLEVREGAERSTTLAKAAAPIAIRALDQDIESEIKIECCEFVGDQKLRQALPALRRLVRDDDATVQSAAKSAIEAIEGE